MTIKFANQKQEINYLRKRVEQLEENKVKLLDSLRLKKEKDSEHYVWLPESSLSNFFHMSKCDQKLMAILYWDKLSDDQKKIFTDCEEIKLQKEHEKKMQAIMTDPTKMRQHFLKRGFPVLEIMLKLASGDTKLSSDNFAFREVWEIMKGIIAKANDPAPMLDLRNKDISEQIDTILTKVTEGDITFVEAKEYMSLVSSGFDLQELPKLMAKLESLESL